MDACKYVFVLQALLLGLGLQHHTVDELEKDLDLPVSQLLGLFNRMIRKIVQVSLISGFFCILGSLEQSIFVLSHELSTKI